MKKQKDIVEDITEQVGSALSNFYDKMLLDAYTNTNLLLGEVVGYRNVKRPKYLEISLPHIEKHYDYDYGEDDGYLLTFRRVRLFRIGTETVSEPIYKKRKGSFIRFPRYNKISPIDNKLTKKKQKKRITTKTAKPGKEKQNLSTE